MTGHINSVYINVVDLLLVVGTKRLEFIFRRRFVFVASVLTLLFCVTLFTLPANQHSVWDDVPWSRRTRRVISTRLCLRRTASDFENWNSSIKILFLALLTFVNSSSSFPSAGKTWPKKPRAERSISLSSWLLLSFLACIVNASSSKRRVSKQMSKTSIRSTSPKSTQICKINLNKQNHNTKQNNNKQKGVPCHLAVDRGY